MEKATEKLTHWRLSRRHIKSARQPRGFDIVNLGLPRNTGRIKLDYEDLNDSPRFSMTRIQGLTCVVVPGITPPWSLTRRQAYVTRVLT